MNPIDKQLEKLRKERRLGFMTHVVVGYPSLDKTVSFVKIMEETGVDFIELQIPFSDPLADGPTIMKACETALKKGVRVRDAFIVANKLSKEIKVPLLFMAYYNTVFKYGTKKFCLDAKKVGVSGLIIPDIPLDEEHEEHFIEYCKGAGLKNIRVISPASTVNRLVQNAKIADGFVYCTARQGITGVEKELDLEITAFLKNVKKHFDIPVAVGFGMSNRDRVKQIESSADIVVIGSAIIDIINSSGQNAGRQIGDFLKSLKV